MEVCLYDSNKHSFVTMNEADQLLYIATDSKYDDQSGLYYYSLKDSKFAICFITQLSIG